MTTNNSNALDLACFFQNQVCELQEIIEMFCLDAAAAEIGSQIDTQGAQEGTP